MIQRLLHRHSVFIFSFLLIFTAVPVCRADRISEDIDTAFNVINEAREREGVGILIPDEYAAVSARLHAEELAFRSSLSHVGLDGLRVADRYRSAGGTGLSAGENLGAGDTVMKIVSAWLDSPSHRRNLLNPDWRKLGLGLHVLESGRVILVAVFTGSRWTLSDMENQNGVLKISGDCLLKPGVVPEGIFLVADSNVWPVTGVSKQGRDRLTAVFEIPREPGWDSRHPVGFSLVWLEQGREETSDMMVLTP